MNLLILLRFDVAQFWLLSLIMDHFILMVIWICWLFDFNAAFVGFLIEIKFLIAISAVYAQSFGLHMEGRM